MPVSKQELLQNTKRIARRFGPPIILIGGGAVIGGGIAAACGWTATEILAGAATGGTIGGFPVGLKAEADTMGITHENLIDLIKERVENL